MANIQSGKIYNIEIGYLKYKEEHSQNYSQLQYYKWIISQIASSLNIEESYFYYNNNSYGDFFFYMPYINLPQTNERVVFHIASDSSESVFMGGYCNLTALNIHDNDIINKPLYETIPIKEDVIYDSDYEYGDNQLSASKYTNLQIDTRFLDSFGFYTVGMTNTNTSVKRTFYYSPTILICDMINMLDNTRSDAILALNLAGHTNILKDGIISQKTISYPSIRAIGLTNGSINGISNKYYDRQGFKPYYFSQNGNNDFTIIKLRFGELQANNDIFLLNTYNKTLLQEYCAFTLDHTTLFNDSWRRKAFMDNQNNNFTIGFMLYDDEDVVFAPVLKGDNSESPVPVPKLVSWETGTDEEIATMIDAYYNDIFSLDDIKSVWKMGDIRTIHLNAMDATYVGESHRAQDIELIILDFEHDDLVSNINNKTKALITVMQKDCLMDAECAAGIKSGLENTERGYMNPTMTSVGGWYNTARRQWCNEIYYNAISSSIFRSLIKETKHSTRYKDGNNQNRIRYCPDYIFFLSAYEVCADNSKLAPQEGNYFTYFDSVYPGKKPFNDPNTYKPSLQSDGGTAWWLRTQYRVSNPTAFGFIIGYSYADIPDSSRADDKLGIAPAMCL